MKTTPLFIWLGMMCLGHVQAQSSDDDGTLDAFLDEMISKEASHVPPSEPVSVTTNEMPTPPPPTPAPKRVKTSYDETSGLSAAQIRELGVDYAEARNGKSKNEGRAIELYRIPADKGDKKAQRWMGWRYRQGRGVPKNEQMARTYFSLAAQQGDIAAAQALDMNGNGGSRFSSTYGNETAGLSAAQIRELGVDYAEARNGKRKNEQRAIQLYIKAADMGDAKAQRWMGWRYRQGRGVPKDELRARTYFSAAARQGDTAAAEALRMK